jgi:hypothetical protein
VGFGQKSYLTFHVFKTFAIVRMAIRNIVWFDQKCTLNDGHRLMFANICCALNRMQYILYSWCLKMMPLIEDNFPVATARFLRNA